MSPAIQKQQFVNQSGGWIGVVLIGPKGDEQGHAVESGQTVWLSEAEQILTANAPRRPEDNPFVAQTLSRTNPESGELEEITVTPLVPSSEDRFVPANSRPIPSDIYGSPFGANAGHEAGLAAEGNIGTDEPTSVSASGDPVAEREEQVTGDPPPAPPKAAEAAAAAEATGAAEPPAGTAATGSFTQGEEVGTPAAPGASAGAPDTDTSTPPFPPASQAAPWTPQDDPARVPPEGGAPGSEE